MKVCICKDVSDRVIREHARQGASLEQVLRATGAGSGCGQCVLAIARLHAAERLVAAGAGAGSGREPAHAARSPDARATAA